MSVWTRADSPTILHTARWRWQQYLCQLVDQSQNTTSGTPEALYVNSLVVPAGTTLDLNGLHLYARAAQIDGTLIGGTLHQIPDSGPLALNTPTSGAIRPSGATRRVDLLRAGRQIGDGPRRPRQRCGLRAGVTRLGWVLVRLLDPMGNVLATADNRATGSGTIVTLNGVLLPTDGTYKIQIQAADRPHCGHGQLCGHRLGRDAQ